MEVCPKCMKPTEAKDKIALRYPVSTIRCPCGYCGLPIKLEKDDSEGD